MNNWHRIWSSKKNISKQKSLDTLLTIDGYSAFDSLDSKEWINFTDHAAKRLEIGKGDSIFDVGCGAGAFLYPFYLKKHPVGGLDYADNLKQIAENYMPQGEFTTCEAAALTVDDNYDFVCSCGMFQYLSGYRYAEEVVHQMIKKARKGIAVLEVSDLSREKSALKIRRGKLGQKEYDLKYKGLEHLYFYKGWFTKFSDEKENRVIIEDQSIKGYPHQSYRFNVYILKNS